MPLPGTPTVALVRPWPTVTCAPRPPTEVDRPRLLRFSRTPGAMRKLRRKRKGITCCRRGPRTTSRLGPRSLRSNLAGAALRSRETEPQPDRDRDAEADDRHDGP